MPYQVEHNGVVVPEPPRPQGLSLRIRGEWTSLTPKQEEMAMAWARKHGTPYLDDPVFAKNYLRDFSRELGLNAPLKLDEIDFQPAIDIVLAERQARAEQTKEERKLLAAQRKVVREAIRARHGKAVVDGEEVDLANYVVEPSGIFMGRGQHPLRGRWKEGASHRDITLNLSPGAPHPEGDWGEIVWQPDSLWVARWQDKLSGKLKYVWLSDTAPIKQEREILKFDEAAELGENIDQVRAHIEEALSDSDAKRRKIATACYLIDALCLRVGDEKDEDEADTVGATTLRPEHIAIHPDHTAEFRFLGKDSVLWHKTIPLPQVVIENLRELMENAAPSNGATASGDRPMLFPDVSSRDVSAFLSEVMLDLSAKVFRTHHATEVVAASLSGSNVSESDPEYKKWRAVKEANLEAAILCNHYKKESATWANSRARYQEREEKAQKRVDTYKARLEEQRANLAELRETTAARLEATTSDEVRRKRKANYAKRIAAAADRVRTAREQVRRAQDALGKIKAQRIVASRSRTWNLGTSLKSYVDPRVLTQWGDEVDYDVLEKYYPKALKLKFAWARSDETEDLAE